jgi:hypothetical protein
VRRGNACWDADESATSTGVVAAVTAGAAVVGVVGVVGVLTACRFRDKLRPGSCIAFFTSTGVFCGVVG